MSKTAASEEPPEEITPKRITVDELYRRSSQFRLWSFKKEDLNNRRININANGTEVAIKRAKKVPIGEGQPPLELKVVTMEEENKLISHYARSANALARVFQMPSQVRATAISYMKKFYLVHSAMEYHPKSVLYTCLFLAAKAENFFISIRSFSKAIPKTTPEGILDLEFKVIESLSFTLLVHHPFRALYGFFLDIPNYLDYDSKKLNIVYEKARNFVNDSLLSDAAFLFTPPQIALAAFYEVDRKIVDKYLARKFLPKEEEKEEEEEETPVDMEVESTETEQSEEELELKKKEQERIQEEKNTKIKFHDDLLAIISECAECCKETISPTREESIEIDKKVYYCLNPEKMLKKREPK